MDETCIETEFLVYGDVTFSGAWGVVKASSIEEARQKIKTGDVDWETKGASLSDWDVKSIEPNE